MKKLILLLILCGTYFFSDAQYVVKKMSDYPAKIGTPPGVDYALFNDSGVTKRVTINQICAVCGTGGSSDSSTFATRHYVDSLSAFSTRAYTFTTTPAQNAYTGLTALNGKTIDAVSLAGVNLSPAQYSKSGTTLTFQSFINIATYYVVVLFH